MSRHLLDDLARLDPADQVEPPTAADRHTLRERIMTSPRPRSSPEPQPAGRSRVPWAVAAAGLAVVAALAVTVVGTTGERSAIATPGLTVPVDADRQPAADTLHDLADAAEGHADQPELPAEQRVTVSWALHTSVSERDADSEIVARSRQWWLHDDGTATECASQPVAMDVLIAQAQKVDDVPDCDRVAQHGPGEHAPIDWPATDDPAELIAQLAGNEELPDHHEVADAYLELAAKQPVSAHDTAVTLRALATFDELRDYGTVTDRAGRQVRAVGYTTDSGGLPTRRLLLLDPDTGQVLGADQTLTRDAGNLDVPIPSVISYRLHFTANDPPPPP